MTVTRDFVSIPGIGVAGNVAGHMAQAGEAGQDAIGSGMNPFFTTFFLFFLFIPFFGFTVVHGLVVF